MKRREPMPPDSENRTDPENRAERRLRRALEPSTEAVARVTRRALEDREPRSRRVWVPATVAAAALAAVIAVIPWPGAPPEGPTGPSEGVPTASVVGSEPEEAPLLHLSNEGGFVTVSNRHGMRWVVLPVDAPPERAASETSSPKSSKTGRSL